MTFSELTGQIIGLLKGQTKLSVCRDFELFALNDAQDVLVTVGIERIQTGSGYLSGDGKNLCRSCTVQLRVNLLGRDRSGQALLELGETLLGRLFSSALEITAAEGEEVSFNAKLGRTQYPLLVTLSGEWDGAGFSCEKRLRAVKVGGMTFLAESVQFARERVLAQTGVLGGSVFAADGGRKPMELTVRGAFSPAETGIAQRLEALALSGEVLEVLLTGETLPPMRLKQYSFSSEKSREAGQCQLTFWSGEGLHAG